MLYLPSKKILENASNTSCGGSKTCTSRLSLSSPSHAKVAPSTIWKCLTPCLRNPVTYWKADNITFVKVHTFTILSNHVIYRTRHFRCAYNISPETSAPLCINHVLLQIYSCAHLQIPALAPDTCFSLHFKDIPQLIINPSIIQCSCTFPAFYALQLTCSHHLSSSNAEQYPCS